MIVADFRFTSIPAELSRNAMRYQVGSVIENAAASIQGCNNSSVKTSNPAAYITDPAKLEMLRSMKDLDNGGSK